MKNKLLILIISIFTTFSLQAVDLAVADSAYMKGNYEEAAALYEQAVLEDGFSAGLLYNLGNSYYRLGKDGEAVVCYERAKKLEPGNRLIRQNLEFLNSKVLESNKGALQGKNGNVEPDRETFMDGIYRIIAIEMKSNSWAILAVMAFILFLGAAAMYVFTPNVLARKTGFFSGITFLAFTVAFLIFAYLGAANFNSTEDGVLMDFTTELLEQPQDNSSPSTTPLHKGTKLKILETRKGKDGTEWIKVKLNTENVGWIKKQQIEII